MNSLRKIQSVIIRLGNRYYKKVGIIGVPFEKGQHKKGVAQGPKVIREAGLIKELELLGLDVKDYGDILYEAKKVTEIDNMTHLGDVAGCTSKLSEQFQQVLKKDQKVLTIGGDHSIGIGTVDGHIKKKGDIALIWVDAHADINTNKTSTTGQYHETPVALLISELADYWPHLPGMDWQKPMLSIRNVAYIGLRELNSYERLLIEKFGITAFGMEDVEKFGIHDVTCMALKKIDPNDSKSIHVSFDIDSLDPLEAPCTGTPVRGGLSLREAIHLMELLYRTKRLNALDIVEVNPYIGNECDVQLTVEAAIHIIQAGFGYNRRGFKVPEGVTDIPLPTNKN